MLDKCKVKEIFSRKTPLRCRHNSLQQQIQTEPNFAGISMLKSICYSHFGNGVGNGVISIT